VTGWSPRWVAPRAPQSSCTGSQVQSIYDACESTSGTRAACSGQDGPCADCIYTSTADAKYGPYVYDNMIGLVNDAGCIALVEGNTTATGCGAKVQALDMCMEQACASACTRAQWSVFVQCRNTAAKTVCAAYTDAALCRTHPQFYVCEAYADFESYFVSIALQFCAPNG
jgi:hypothetical protein